MPTTISKTVYTFKELLSAHERDEVSTHAVENARAWLQKGATDYEWWDFVYDDWTRMLEAVGFTDPKINFSGFWSQGDGASFTSGIDFDVLIPFLADPPAATKNMDDAQGYVVHACEGVRSNLKFSRLLWLADYISGKVRRVSHHYSHEGTCDAELEFDLPSHDSGLRDKDGWIIWEPDHPRLAKLWREFHNAVETLRTDLCYAIYKSLEQEYEWRCADEQLIEDSEANEFTFDEDGDREDGDRIPPIDHDELASWVSMC